MEEQNNNGNGIVEAYRYSVGSSLAFNKGILDCLTKYQGAAAALSRAVVKSSSLCGCVRIAAERQSLCHSAELTQLNTIMQTHVNGKLCRRCRENIERELGACLYYLTGIANAFDTDLEKLMNDEIHRSQMLGKYYVK